MGSSFNVGQYTYYRQGYALLDRHDYSRWSPGETKTVTIPSMVSGYEYIEGESSIRVTAGWRTTSATVSFKYGEEGSKGGRSFSFEYIPPSTINITSLLEVTLMTPSIRLECTGYSTSEVNAKVEGVYMEYASLDAMPATVSDGTRTYSVTSARACYKNCAIQNAPALSSNLLEMNECFYNCSQLVTAPTIPSGVENMDDCFYGCSSLTQAPEIPSGVMHILNCFKNCASLQGNIVVHTNVSMSDSGFPVFSGTVNNIFIVDRGTEATTWKQIASYSNNVHYETDDAIAPVITNFNAIRVDAFGDTTPEPTGLYAYVTAKLSTDKTNIPVGWTNEIKAKILTDNGSTVSPTWYSQSGTDPLQVWCWISLGDTSTHGLTMQITDSIKEGSTEKKSQQSQVVYASILKSYALIDYYHDEDASGVTEGMAIGKYAEHVNLLDIDMPTKHRQALQCDDDVSVGGELAITETVSAENLLLQLDTSGASGTVDDDIYADLVSLGWDTDVIV